MDVTLIKTAAVWPPLGPANEQPVLAADGDPLHFQFHHVVVVRQEAASVSLTPSSWTTV
jgi:hypothetical protein